MIANRGTLSDPRWVRAEVEEFRRRHPERPVIPISIGGALQDPAHAAAAQDWLQFADRIWIDDTQAACDQGIVSDAAIDRLVTAPTAVRTSARWRWTVRVAFGVLALVTVAALWFAWSDRQNAATARANAELARENEAKADANADSAQRESERAQKAEGEALSEAEAARIAERRARAGRLVAESQSARSNDPALGLLLARESWLTERIPEARRALYEALFEEVPLVLGQALGELRYVSYSANGKYLAASGADARVHLWRLDGLAPVW